jgi:PII-like signaling protein
LAVSFIGHAAEAVATEASDQDGLKLTAYFGERDRVAGRLVADALMDVLARREIRSSMLARGIGGYGLEHHLRTDRLLTLSEDLPLVVVAVDTRERIEGIVPEVLDVKRRGLLTVEPVELGSPALPTDAADEAPQPDGTGENVALTIYLGRHQRVAGRPAFLAACQLLREEGVAGATTLLGVDGTRNGVRRRARFFAANGDIPMAILAVGTVPSLSRAAPRLAELLGECLITTERVMVCRRDGESLASPIFTAEARASAQQTRHKLVVVGAEATQHEGRPVHIELVRRLRQAGAAGATSLRGIWGYHGDHAPHGDRLLSLRRHVPVVTSVIDTPERIARFYPIVEELTDRRGLVTSQSVPFCSPPSIVTTPRGCSSVG